MNIVLFGKPGSGKGTIANLLVQEYRLSHISTGDLLRQEVIQQTTLGKDIQALMESGNFVDDSIVEFLMINFIKNNKSQGYIFDGIPRNETQCHSFDSIVKKLNMYNFHYICLDCSDSVCINRMQERAQNETRLDANTDENISRKLQVYYKQTEHAIKHYDNSGKLCKVNANLSIKEVFKHVKEVIDIKREL